MGWAFGLLFFFVLFAAATYTLYWYDTANGPGLEKLRSLSKGRVRTWLVLGFLWAVAAQITAAFTFPLGWLPKRKGAATRSDTRDPIVVTVHGLYHNKSAFIFLERALKRAGIHDIRPWTYSSRGEAFFPLAEKLRGHIEALHRSAPSRPLFLVGHSLGGLLARHAAWTARQGTVSGCLTLGTPHQGSRLAVFAVGSLGKSLGFRSRLFEDLESLENLTPEPPFSCLALASPVDNMVLPQEALLPTAAHWQVRWTPPMSHVAMLYHPAVLRTVVSWVKATLPQNPSRMA
ncbi:MAG: alpha/beta fold hydrolase [Desulfosoma sp.]